MKIAQLLATSLAFASAVAVAVPASADFFDPATERAYADSYGNLVINSRAGYKRIVVGQGHLAPRQTAEDGPSVVYLDDQAYRVRNIYRCAGRPGIVHGRSYMYGLPDGVVRVIGAPCR